MTNPTSNPLPYAFDTSRTVRLILRGVLGLELIMIVPGVVYSLLVSHDPLALALLVVIGVMISGFGLLVVRHLEATRGTISADAVEVEPASFCGIPLAGVSGSFRLQQFRAIRLVRVSAPVDPMVQAGPSTRLYLVGGSGTPDVLIARAGTDAGSVLGRDLGAALHLPLEESRAPY